MLADRFKNVERVEMDRICLTDRVLAWTEGYSRLLLVGVAAMGPVVTQGAADAPTSRITAFPPATQMLLASTDAGGAGSVTPLVTGASLDIPHVDDLVARVNQQLPGFWETAEFRIVAKAAQGDPINPRTLIRFETDAQPKADLFMVTGDGVGPFTVVAKTLEKNVARTLHGTMQLSYRAGQWHGEAVIENPVDQLGQPVDFFPTPTLELGSERQTEILAAMRSEAIGVAQAAMEAELRRISAEQEERVDRLRAEAAASLRRLEQEHAAQLESQSDSNRKALTEIETTFQDQLAALQDRYEPKVRDAQDRLDQQAARYSEQLAAMRSDLREVHDVEMRALTEAHAKAMGETRARQAQELAELETGYGILKQALEQRIAEADELIAKQELVIAKSETIADNNAWIDQLATAAITKRSEDLSGLLGNWRGVVTCGDEQSSVEFVAQEVHGTTGVRGEYSDSWQQPRVVPAVLALNDRSLVIPATLTLSLSDTRNQRLRMADLVLDETGRMIGKNRGQPDCKFVLSR